MNRFQNHILFIVIVVWFALASVATAEDYIEGKTGPGIFVSKPTHVAPPEGLWQTKPATGTWPQDERWGVFGATKTEESDENEKSKDSEPLPTLDPSLCPLMHDMQKAKTRSHLVRERNLVSVSDNDDRFVTLVTTNKTWVQPLRAKGAFRLNGIRESNGQLSAEISIQEGMLCGGSVYHVHVDDRLDPGIQILWMNESLVLLRSEDNRLYYLSTPDAPPVEWRMIWDAGVDLSFESNEIILPVVDNKKTKNRKKRNKNKRKKKNNRRKFKLEAQRAVTTLCYIDGYSQAEVGEFLEIPVSTVKSRLFHARKNLQQTMSDMLETSVKQHAPGAEFTRKVEEILDGVEHIEWKKGCNCFSGSVVACMQYLKEELTYHFVSAVSGAAFHIQWAWEPDNCDPEVTLGEELARRTFRALGYDYTQITDFEKVRPESSETAWRKRILANIDRGRPIIARGVVGPPECCVIAGYAQEGEVLLGRSYFYPDSKGYFRKSDWYKECFGLIEIGEKIEAPPRGEILRQTLEWALELAQTPEMNGRATGLAAYDHWADALEQDKDFPEDDMETLGLRCMATVNDGFGYLVDVRYSAGEFLKSIADECREAAAELRAAAEAFKAESEWHCRGMKLGPTSFAPDEEIRRIADPVLRGEMAVLVREAGVQYREAIGHIRQALDRL